MKTILSLLAVLLMSPITLAGDLEPSAPPTSGTMKTLDQVQPAIPISSVPFTIAAGGSYYLTQDLTAPGTGITVDADDVTIDFCGFKLTGLNSTMAYGILLSNQNNVEIRNGTVTGFAVGIAETNTAGRCHRVTNMRVLHNTLAGIQLYGQGHAIRGCTVAFNGKPSATGSVYGIYAGLRAAVSGNTVYGNGNSSQAYVYGISTGDGSMVTDNTCTENGVAAAGQTVYVLKPGYGSLVSGNTVSYNGNGAATTYGIQVVGGTTLIRNTASNNSATATCYGIHAVGCAVDQNTAYSNTAPAATNLYTTTCSLGTNFPAS